MKLIQKDFGDSIHVRDSGLTIPATDILIWSWARQHDYLIVTNDDDFLNLLIQKNFPPKIVLLRTGNQSTLYLANLLLKQKDKIKSMAESDEYGVIEIY